MAALPQRTGCGADLHLEGAPDLFQPLDRLHGVRGKELHQFRIAHVVATLERRLVELLHRVFNALLVLAIRVDGVQRTARHVGGAAQNAALLHNDHFGAGLRRPDGRNATATAAAHDAHVRLQRRLLLLCGPRAFKLRSARLRAAVFHSLQKRHARKRCPRDRIHIERLRRDDVVGDAIQRVPSNAGRFQAAACVDAGNGMLGKGDHHVERRIVACHPSRVGSRRENLCRTLRLRLTAACKAQSPSRKPGKRRALDKASPAHPRSLTNLLHVVPP